MTKPKMKVKSKGCKPTRNKKYCSSRRATRRSRCKSAIIVVISAHLATNFGAPFPLGEGLGKRDLASDLHKTLYLQSLSQSEGDPEKVTPSGGDRSDEK